MVLTLALTLVRLLDPEEEGTAFVRNVGIQWTCYAA